jgi:hypothetical protein
MLLALFPVCRAGHAALQGPHADRRPRWSAIITTLKMALISALRETPNPTLYINTAACGFNPSKVHELEGRNARWCRFDPCS